MICATRVNTQTDRLLLAGYATGGNGCVIKSTFSDSNRLLSSWFWYVLSSHSKHILCAFRTQMIRKNGSWFTFNFQGYNHRPSSYKTCTPSAECFNESVTLAVTTATLLIRGTVDSIAQRLLFGVYCNILAPAHGVHLTAAADKCSSCVMPSDHRCDGSAVESGVYWEEWDF